MIAGSRSMADLRERVRDHGLDLQLHRWSLIGKPKKCLGVYMTACDGFGLMQRSGYHGSRTVLSFSPESRRIAQSDSR